MYDKPKRTSAHPRSETVNHPYMKKDKKNQMVMKAKNSNTEGLGEVKHGKK
jgi:hypothetical protein